MALAKVASQLVLEPLPKLEAFTHEEALKKPGRAGLLRTQSLPARNPSRPRPLRESSRVRRERAESEAASKFVDFRKRGMKF